MLLRDGLWKVAKFWLSKVRPSAASGKPVTCGGTCPSGVSVEIWWNPRAIRSQLGGLLGGASSAWRPLARETSLAPHATTGDSRCPWLRELAMVQTACGPQGLAAPRLFFSLHSQTHLWWIKARTVDCLRRLVFSSSKTKTTLSGGSLGSCVDEERSQLRELMWIAGHIEHRHFERILRPRVRPLATPVWGSAKFYPSPEALAGALNRRSGSLCCSVVPSADSVANFLAWPHSLLVARPLFVSQSSERSLTDMARIALGIQPTCLDVSPRETRCPREKRRRATNSYFRPQIGRDYPLNLSIKLVVTTVTQNQRRSVLECYRRAREGGGVNTHTYIGREPNRGAPKSHWNQES